MDKIERQELMIIFLSNLRGFYGLHTVLCACVCVCVCLKSNIRFKLIFDRNLDKEYQSKTEIFSNKLLSFHYHYVFRWCCFFSKSCA